MGFLNTPGLQFFLILTTRNLLDAPRENLSVSLEGGCDLKGDLYPVFL